MSANQARHTWASRLVAASLILGAMLGGCASPVSELKAYEPVSQADELKAYRSVLRQPERLSPAPPPTGAYRWQDPKANFAQYDKVLLTRIFVTLDDKAEYKSIDPVTQAKLTEYFRQAIVKALQPKYPVVTQRGSGVLVVRITLVDLVPVNVAEDLAYQAAPFGAGLAAELAEGPVMGEGFGSAPFLGRTGVVASTGRPTNSLRSTLTRSSVNSSSPTSPRESPREWSRVGINIGRASSPGATPRRRSRDGRGRSGSGWRGCTAPEREDRLLPRLCSRLALWARVPM